MAEVRAERRGAVALLTYANPPLGTMTGEGSVRLLEAVEKAAADDEVRALVLAGGVPGVFIRHYSVEELADASEQLQGAPPPDFGGSPFARLTDTLAAMPKPVIAAVNGLCMGGGFELALACDLRIAGEDVTAVGLPETRVGIFPGGGGTQRLPRLVGEAKALEIILRGATFHAREAHALGLVHEVSSDPVRRALDIAVELSTRNPAALAAAKQLVRSALDRPLAEGLPAERRAFAAVMTTPGAASAMRAFVQGGASLDQS